MDTQEYLEKMKIIHNSLLMYIEKMEGCDQNFQDLSAVIVDSNIKNNSHEIKSVLYLLSKISNNHHRSPQFFDKIGQIFQIFKDDIQKYFSSYEIFKIFRKNKRILLLLIENQIISVDKTIVNVLKSEKYYTAKYPLYFFPEIKPFTDENLVQNLSKEIPENFDKKRKIGENDSKICELIRNGSLDDFTSYIEQTKFPLSSEIEPSIFETNSFLVNKKPTLIEYASFFGSVSIVKYLNDNFIDISPSLWIYAIHSQNIEMIHFLEEKKINQIDNSFEKTLREAIKCHHNDLANYFLSTFPPTETKTSLQAFSESFKYYNFGYTSDAFVNGASFYNLCFYGYYPLVEILLKISNVNVNEKIISK